MLGENKEKELLWVEFGNNKCEVSFNRRGEREGREKGRKGRREDVVVKGDMLEHIALGFF